MSPTRTGADGPTTRPRPVADPALPRLHFVPPTGWMNDPNGLAQIDGTYHLFYQANPDAPEHHLIRWAHATSADLLTWHDLPLALAPSPGPDEAGCYSGVLVVVDGVPTLVYSGHAPERHPTEVGCHAVSHDGLVTWEKSAANPLLTPPAEPEVRHMRDHCVWFDGEVWQHLVGASLTGRGGAVLRYTSPDARSWTYAGVFLESADVPAGDVEIGTMWECPDLVVEGDRAALVFSAWDEGRTIHTVQVPGHLEGASFTPTGPARMLDHGGRHFYAPQSFVDDTGRRVQLGWSQEARDPSATKAAGWSGCLTLPREIRLDDEGAIRASLAHEVLERRSSPRPAQRASTGRAMVDELTGTCEIAASAHLPSPGDTLTIRLVHGASEERSTTLTLRREGAELLGELDRSRSSGAPLDERTPLSGRFPAGPGGAVDVTVVVDRSILEIFVGGVPLTARVYPEDPSTTRVVLTATSPSATTACATLDAVSAWDLDPVWIG